MILLTKLERRRLILFYPNIPTITPFLSITTEQTVSLLLASNAIEALALAHIINTQAEELESVLGTLPTGTKLSAVVSLANLLAVECAKNPS